LSIIFERPSICSVENTWKKKILTLVYYLLRPQMKIELYHDILAREVFKIASREDKLRLKIEHLVQEHFRQYKERSVFMGQEDLEYILPYFDILDLSIEEREFIKLNRKKVLKERSRRRQLSLIIIGVLLTLLSITAISYARSRESQFAQRGMKLALHGFRELENGKPSLAFRLVQNAHQLKRDSTTSEVIREVLEKIMSSGLKCDLVHTGNISILEISRNDQYILTASTDGKVNLWNWDCQIMRTFYHRGPVLAASFSSDSRYLLTASADSTAVLRNLESGDSLVLPHPAPVTFSSFSPDDQLISTGCADFQGRLFDLQGKQYEAKGIQLSDTLMALEFAPSGQFIMAASRDEICVKDVQILERNVIEERFKPEEPLKIARFISFNKIFVAFVESGGMVLEKDGAKDETPFYRYLNNNIRDDDQIHLASIEVNPSTNYPEVLLTMQDSIWFIKKWSYGKIDTSNNRPITIMDYVISSTKQATYVGLFSKIDKILMGYEDFDVVIRENGSGNLIHRFKSEVKLARYAHQDSSFVTVGEGYIAHLWFPSNHSTDSITSIERIFEHYESHLANFPKDQLLKYYQ
jgi:WD40 repeat protein